MKNRFKHFFLLCFSFSIYAQDSIPKNKFEPSLNSYVGYLIPNYPDSPKSNYTFMNSLGFTWQSRGKDKWHQLYNFPKFGFDVYYSTFGNPAQLGYNIGLVPAFEFRGKKDKNFRFKFGLGNAWFSKPFNLLTNPNNYYIGRHFTSMTNLGIYWTARISKKLALTYGFSSLHCSDGHTALPNAGMNIISAHLGLRFEETREFSRKEFATEKFKWRVGARLGYGPHKFGETTKAVGGPSYPTYHASGWMYKSYKNIHVVQLGLTLSYYSSFYDYIHSQGVYPSDQQLRSCTGVAFIGHEFILGKVAFVSQAGIYFYNPFFIKQRKISGSWKSLGEKLEAFNTNRVGLTYYPLKKRNSLNNIGKQLSLSVFIKANLGQADLYEYAIGYSF
jgi:hypothetical protein